MKTMQIMFILYLATLMMLAAGCSPLAVKTGVTTAVTVVKVAKGVKELKAADGAEVPAIIRRGCL